MNGQYHNPNDNWRHRIPYRIEPHLGCMLHFFATLVMGSAVIIAIVVLAALIHSCAPRTIETVIVKTDTVYHQKLQRDSIYVNDSIYIKEFIAGDTVRITTDRWHTRWRDRLVHDTAYVSKYDTLRITKTIESHRKLSGWKWFQIWAGRLALIALACSLANVVIMRRRKI